MKILITATVQSHICQFHSALIKALKKQGHTVEVAAKNNMCSKPGLSLECADKVYDIPFERNPFKAANIKAYKILKKIIDENKYDIIHCNTPVGGVVTRLAGKKARKNGTKIIYTAHGFHFYEGAPLKNWLIYYTAEKLMFKNTDILLTINTDDFKLAKEKFGSQKVGYIHGAGFDKSRFHHEERTKEQLREEFGIPVNATVIVSVGELNNNKNQIVVLDSLNKLKDEDIYYLVCGNGPNEQLLKATAVEYGIEKNVKFLGYRRDLDTIFEMSDIFIHTAIREGLGLVIVEAMECGLIPVCSDIRGVRDLVKNGENGFLVNPMDSTAVADKIKFIKQNTFTMNINEKNRVIETYSTDNVINEILAFYGELKK